MNQHYTNCMSLMEGCTEMIEMAAEYQEAGDTGAGDACLDMSRMMLMRAQIEATLATLTENQING